MFQPRDLLKVLGSLRALQSQPHGRRRGVRTLREEVGGAGVGGAAGVTGKFLQISTFCNWNTFWNRFFRGYSRGRGGGEKGAYRGGGDGGRAGGFR